jgi:hypothetical protein
MPSIRTFTKIIQLTSTGLCVGSVHILSLKPKEDLSLK